ncbi:MAG: hypothetical protein JSV51_05715 [Candidatus Bathyarchaeota archaeon]|nr:MAG: hypothetical protein JSV51_05715 [Candidatus Bathyarchaeota archaeon]
MIHEVLNVIIRVLLVLATSFLFGIVFLAYLRIRSKKMLFILIGFGIFFVHALIYIPELFVEDFRLVLTENLHLLIHLIALIFIALGMFKD